MSNENCQIGLRWAQMHEKKIKYQISVEMSTNAAEKNSYASYKHSEHSMKYEYNSEIAETEPHLETRSK